MRGAACQGRRALWREAGDKHTHKSTNNVQLVTETSNKTGAAGKPTLTTATVARRAATVPDRRVDKTNTLGMGISHTPLYALRVSTVHCET